MSKLFYMDESGEWRELFECVKMPEFIPECDALKDYSVNAGINMCRSCGRISPLPFPHMNGAAYCPECLIKRMK